MPTSFGGSILCEDCDPFMTKIGKFPPMIKCKNCDNTIPDIVASYEDEFCSEECYEEYNELYNFIGKIAKATGDTHLCDKLLKKLRITK